MGSPTIAPQFQFALEASPCGMAVVDKQGRIVFANSRMEAIFGQPRDGLVGVCVDELVPESVRPRHRQLRENYMLQPAVRLMGTGRDLYAAVGDGRLLPIEIGLNPVEIDGEPYVICSIVDITLRKDAEAFEATARELEIARRIQQNLLPREIPQLQGYDVAGASQPASETGGDYFDVIPVADGSLVMVVGDVSGHGFGPALLMAVTRTYLRPLVDITTDMGVVMYDLNRYLCRDTLGSHFVTLFLAHLDPRHHLVQYAAAGHVAYHFNASGTSVRIQSTSLPLGIMEGIETPTGPQLVLQPGEILLMVTDGIPEASTPDGSTFGEARMLECVQANRGLPASQIVESLHAEVRAFTQGGPQQDDITTLLVKRSPG